MEEDRPPESPRSSTSGEGLIFVSDASAEAERLTVALRARGYIVVDVPLGLLLGRISVQQPALILIDADAHGAADVVHDIKATQKGDQAKLVLLGQPGRALHSTSLAELSNASFQRPVEVYALLRKVEGLIGTPRFEAPVLPASHRPGVLVAAARKPYRYEASESNRPSPDELAQARPSRLPPPRSSQRPPSERPKPLESPAPPIPPGFPEGFGLSSGGQSNDIGIPQARLSPEIAGLLRQAERDADAIPAAQQRRLSPQAEVEAVLPSDVLESLEEPLEPEDDDSEIVLGTRSGSAPKSGTSEALGTAAETASGHSETGPHSDSKPGTADDAAADDRGETPPAEGSESMHPSTAPTSAPPAPGSRPTGATKVQVPRMSSMPATGARPSLAVQPALDRPATFAPEASADERILAHPSTLLPNSEPAATTRDPAPISDATESEHKPRQQPAEMPKLPERLGPGQAIKALASAIRVRATGALAAEDSSGVRRVVFRDGDFCTAASSAAGETLLQFLVQRGDLDPDRVQGLSRRVPPFGRYAGAALIAHGHLRQDDLWGVLRAHAEWLIGRVISMEQGACSWETEAPGRLRDEPSVFGGATGAEVFLDVAQRVVDARDALQRIGGPGARFSEGPSSWLLSECALRPTDANIVMNAKGRSAQELSSAAGASGFATILYGLSELGVLSRFSALAPADSAVAQSSAELDAEAVRQRIEARKALVVEGDYFALLGLRPGATRYEVERAYEQLKGQFSREQLENLGLLDLLEDVDLILEVLAEAHEILRDDIRRERYRQAIQSGPS